MAEYKSFYKTVGGNEGGKCHYPTRLDPYGCGCQHDCKYCYAKSLLDFRGLWHQEAPNKADMSKVVKVIAKMPKDAVVRLGGLTDPFQPIERTEKLTYKTIQALNEAKIEYLIVTKSAMIAEDEYIKILDKNLAHIQITITTTDDTLARTYEKASPPSERIKAIEKLSALGYDVSVRLSPFISEYVDYDILNHIQCDKILVEFLRANSWIQKWFDIDYSDYTVKQSGYRHLLLAKKIALLQNINGFKQISVCEDEDEAYAYWRDNVNVNKDDCCNLRRAKK